MSSNTMYVNYMTKTYNNFLKSYTANHKQEEVHTFAEKMAEKSAESAGLDKVIETITISSEDMSLEEYKQYIYNEISNIPVNETQMDSSFIVQISDAGFEAMKNDPEYEKWVLDTLKYDFGFQNPWGSLAGGRYVIHNFGATKEEYHGESWHAESKVNSKQSEESFWERRVERRKKLQEQFEKLQTKKALQKKILEKKLMENKYKQQHIQQSYFSAELLLNTLDTETSDFSL
ncbi:MAG: hypothetical protein K1V96_08450 [Lachnospiraceae bacterium]